MPSRRSTTESRLRLLGILLFVTVLAAPVGAVPGRTASAIETPHAAPTGTTAANAPIRGVPTVHGISTELRPHASRPGLRPTATGISPYNFYTHEPAPVGISDFGLDGSGNPYAYNSSEFLGVTYLRNLSVYNASDGLPWQLTIQLNVVLDFTLGGIDYQYWIQDVAFLDTSVNSPTFVNNIWNFSAGNGSMGNDGPTGNGSVYGDAFYEASATGDGNGIQLPAISEIDLLVIAAKDSSGRPTVAFDYRDGATWYTFDNVVFPFAYHATLNNFVVDGNSYAPNGLYDDAELVLGGPGGGTETQAVDANLSMALETYNGHNFQAVRNAYDFGSDTAEDIANLHLARSGSSTNASLADDLSIGSGTLGSLYGSGYSTVVNVSTDVAKGTLFVGTSGWGVDYTGGEINLTIAPGTYLYAIYNATGAIANVPNVTAAAGGYRTLTVDAQPVFGVQFVETGLFNSHRWNVNLGLASLSTRGNHQWFYMSNGTYLYSVPRIPGFILNLSSGAVVVDGSSQNIVLNFWAVTYGVQIYETGLPSSTNWSVTVFNHTYATGGISVAFGLPNGSWNYSLGLVAGWSAYAENRGQLDINARAILETFSFQRFRETIYVNESGLPDSTFWYVNIGSDWTNGSVPTLLAAEPNGSYHFRIQAAAGWEPNPRNGTLDVDGGSTALVVHFAPFQFPVTFAEHGLAAGLSWGVRFGTVYDNSTTPTDVVLLANGTYPYTEVGVPGYSTALPNRFGVTVDGFSLNVSVNYTVLPTRYGTVTGTISPVGADLVIDGTPYAYQGSSFTFRLVVGDHNLTVSAMGYHPYSELFVVGNDSTTTLAAISLVSLSGVVGGTTPTPLTHGASVGSSATTNLALAGGIVALGALAVGLLMLRFRRR